MPYPTAFRHITPAYRVHLGADCLAQLGPELARAGAQRALILCGASLLRDTAALDLVREALGPRLAGVFGGVRAHSPLPDVLAAVAALRDAQADAVVAVGGGSAVVTGRAAAILLGEGRDIHEICTRTEPGRSPVSPRLAAPKLPQLVVATTPTTAYAKAGTAVIDPALGRRLAMLDPKTRAQALFIHPALAATTPADLVRGAALNTFVMAVQGLESATRDPLADAGLFHALRLMRHGLGKLGTDADDAHLRGDLMLAALLCGEATDHTTGALASVLGHAVGARFHLDNGLVNAALLPHTLRFNAPATSARLGDLAELLGADREAGPEAAIDAVARLLAALPIPRRLRDMGVPEDGLALAAADAEADWFLHQNPRPVGGAAELEAILRAAW